MARNAPLKSEEKKEKQNAVPADDVDKIRDIIFGGQMREYAARFEHLEKLVTARIEQLAADIDKRFDRLAERLTAEAKERERSLLASGDKIATVEESLTAALAETESRWNSATASLRDDLTDGQRELSAMIEKAGADLSASLSADIARLERRKLATDDLATLFAEVARDLKRDAK